MTTTYELQCYERDGYVVIRQLFSHEEVERFRTHYMRLRAEGSYPGDLIGVDPTSTDPLKRYPRMIHMHRWDELSLTWLLDPRLNRWLTALLGREPYAVQTMLYFKPPGARGQALHQDQYFLQVQPGTCMAAWLALDRSDEASGCMQVVPGSHTWPVLCTQKADTTQSFTDVTVPLPEGTDTRAVIMEPGDVLRTVALGDGKPSRCSVTTGERRRDLDPRDCGAYEGVASGRVGECLNPRRTNLGDIALH